MAAPDGIKWGSIVGGYGKIGIYAKLTSTNTKTTVDVEVWFCSKYSVSDTNNSYYYNNLSTTGSATTKIGSVSINTSVDTGEGWSTSNQKKIGSSSYTYSRSKTNVTRYLYAKLADVDRVGGTMTASLSFTIPKLPSFTVKYDANGGSGAPSSQTKLYDQTLPQNLLELVIHSRDGLSHQVVVLHTHLAMIIHQTLVLYYTPFGKRLHIKLRIMPTAVQELLMHRPKLMV